MLLPLPLQRNEIGCTIFLQVLFLPLQDCVDIKKKVNEDGRVWRAKADRGRQSIVDSYNSSFPQHQQVKQHPLILTSNPPSMRW
jgi:hypothetical protein